MLSEQAKEARRKYKREWAHRNPEKVKASTARYWEKKAAESEAEAPENSQAAAAAAG